MHLIAEQRLEFELIAEAGLQCDGKIDRVAAKEIDSERSIAGLNDDVRARILKLELPQHLWKHVLAHGGARADAKSCASPLV